MKNIITRTITGVLFAAVLISGMAYNTWSFLGLFLVITGFCMWEFYSISVKVKIKTQKYYGIIMGLAFFGCNYLYATAITDARVFVAMIPLCVLVFVFELYRNKPEPFTNIAFTFLGVIYIAAPFSLLNYFVHMPNGTEVGYSSDLILGFFFLMWTYDTGAYLFGVTLGKHRLFERISPKKSWEGAIGGMLVAGGLGYLLSIFFTDYSLTNWLIISGIVVVFGTFGDLTESLFKRSIDIKDTGNILPGHGGVLDRFDAILLTAPLIFSYVMIFVR